jgi:hypothetical protein
VRRDRTNITHALGTHGTCASSRRHRFVIAVDVVVVAVCVSVGSCSATTASSCCCCCRRFALRAIVVDEIDERQRWRAQSR